jgi:hypothetical protein
MRDSQRMATVATRIGAEDKVMLLKCVEQRIPDGMADSPAM